MASCVFVSSHGSHKDLAVLWSLRATLCKGKALDVKGHGDGKSECTLVLVAFLLQLLLNSLFVLGLAALQCLGHISASQD